MAQNYPIPVILGQTASSKTAVGISLAKVLKGEVISVDSRKVYQGLPIGTATPKGTWDKGVFRVQDVPHHLMGHLKPDQPYTAGDFARDAESLIETIQRRQKIPILVGGTGFYFNALKNGLPQLPHRDDAFRKEMATRIEEDGLDSLRKELEKVDLVSAQAISSGDKHKLIRALEVYRLTGEPFSKWKEAPKKVSSFSFCVFGLSYTPENLEERIKVRSQRMFENGMIEEAERVLNQGFSRDCPALSSFGYREAVQVLDGTLPKTAFLPRLIKGTLAYAKRQRTWFRTQVEPHWFECDENSKTEDIALKMRDFLQFP